MVGFDLSGCSLVRVAVDLFVGCCFGNEAFSVGWLFGWGVVACRFVGCLVVYGGYLVGLVGFVGLIHCVSGYLFGVWFLSFCLDG